MTLHLRIGRGTDPKLIGKRFPCIYLARPPPGPSKPDSAGRLTGTLGTVLVFALTADDPTFSVKASKRIRFLCIQMSAGSAGRALRTDSAETPIARRCTTEGRLYEGRGTLAV